MEKKRTKIAYFTAVGVFLVLLVVLGLTYRETPLPTLEVEGEPVLADTPFAGTFWSLLPPIVAIVLALISKEVYSSLFLGCLVGALLYAQFAPWDTIVALVGADYGIVSVLADSGNMGIIVFLVTLGIMVDLMNKGGGSEAFGRWASKTVKTRCAAQLLTMLLGVLIFVDDYFNCLTVGAVMRPVTESHKISRAKLAYLIDATAAPVCMIAPVSSWAAAVSGYVQSDAVNGIEMFIKQIPWNYYCLLTLVMIVVLSVMNIDYGSMLTHEYNAQVKDDLFTTPERPFEGADDYEKPARGRSSVLDLLLPVVVLIVVCIVSLIWSGDHEKKIVSYHEIGHALVAAMQTHSAPVQKITIVPRTSGALGYTMQVEEGNHYLMTKEEMENKIATLTGGRAAEEVAFGSVTTGASNDIEQATKLARAMITRYGMSDDFGMVALETVTNQYLGGDASLACSADTQTKIDQQVVELVKREHDKAVDILTANREKLDRLAAFLYEKETITGEEFMHILGE